MWSYQEARATGEGCMLSIKRPEQGFLPSFGVIEIDDISSQHVPISKTVVPLIGSVGDKSIGSQMLMLQE